VSTFRKLRSFCRVLKGNRLWRRSHNALRTRIEGEDTMDFCPITYVYFVATGEAASVGAYHRCGDYLRLSIDEIETIACAADGCLDTVTERKLRRILEKACGV
jgi:hypothetical protein